MSLRESHQVGVRTKEWIVTPFMSPTLAACEIFLAGWSEASDGFRFFRNRFPKSQVLAGIAGWGEVLVDREWRRCEPGMAYLTPPGVLHAYRAATDSPWTICWVTYDSDIVRAAQPILVPVDPEPLFTVVKHLYAEATGAADPEVLADWTRLVHAQARRLAAQPGSPGDTRLRALWDAVLANPAHSWRVEELATRAGISGEHLRRLCQKEHGCGPMEHVTRLRMRHAAALLASHRYTIAAVAERVGYDNPFAFSTAFKRCVGATPSRFRDAAR